MANSKRYMKTHTNLQVVVPNTEARKIRAFCKAKGVSVSSFLRKLAHLVIDTKTTTA